MRGATARQYWAMTVSVDPSGTVVAVTMDDGKVNALASEMLAEVVERLDQAQADEAVVILTGREGTFSAGFDLNCPPEGWPEMVAGGARLAERMLTYPHPLVIACSGHAIAMGAFTLLAGESHRLLPPRAADKDRVMPMEELSAQGVRVRARGTMMDVLGRVHEVDREIDVAGWWEMAVAARQRLVRRPLDRIAEELRELRRAVERGNDPGLFSQS